MAGEGASAEWEVERVPGGYTDNGWADNGWADNGWADNGYTDNGYTDNGLMGNPANIDFLVSNPLVEDVVNNDAAINHALKNEQTRTFFKYLYSCAAPAGATLNYRNLGNPTDKVTFYGSLGLGESSQWATSAVGSCDDTCNQLVSACLGVRANKFGIRVPMSLRGDAKPLQEMAKAIPGYGYYKSSSNAVASTLDCTSATWGLTRNCGWRTAYVGWCEGGTVRVGAGCNGLGSSTGDTMLRVCSKIHNCDNSGAVVRNDDTCGLNPYVEFTCPPEGMFFNVMWAPYHSEGTAVADPDVVGIAGSGRVIYPAPEGPTVEQNGVFYIREGAFYGRALGKAYMHPKRLACPYSVDKGGNLVAACPVQWDDNESRLPHLYSCTAPGWNNANLYWADRQCSGGSCASKYTGDCNVACGISSFSSDLMTGAALHDYNFCVGEGVMYEKVITDFVNDRTEQCTPKTAWKCAGDGNGLK